MCRPANEMPFRPSQLFTEDLLQLPSGTLIVMLSSGDGFGGKPYKTLAEFRRVLPWQPSDSKDSPEPMPFWFECVDLNYLDPRMRFYRRMSGVLEKRVTRRSLGDKNAQPYYVNGKPTGWNECWWMEIAGWDANELPPHLAQKRRCSLTQDIRETHAVEPSQRIAGKHHNWPVSERFWYPSQYA